MIDLRSDATIAAPSPLARAIAAAIGKPGLLTTAVAGLALSPAVFATTYTVTNTNDSGSGSLRDAIVQANSTLDADTITFASNVTGTITLTSGSLYIESYYGGNLHIQGPGSATLTIDGGATAARATAPTYSVGSVFVVDGSHVSNRKPAAALASAAVTISGLTITGGEYSYGGGIRANDVTLDVNDCVVTGNVANGSGGGIYIEGYSLLTVNNSTISNNLAQYGGGGIATSDYGSAITIQQSSLTGNKAKYGGGIAIHTDSYKPLTITGSSISGNQASPNYVIGQYFGGVGGGIYLKHTALAISGGSSITGNTAVLGGGIVTYSEDYDVTLTDATISGNQASNSGGGMFNYGYASLSNTTVAGNHANYGGGVLNLRYASLSNTTVAGNTANVAAGVANGAAAYMTISNSTVSGNSASNYGGGLVNFGTLAAANTVIGGNTAATDPDVSTPTYGTYPAHAIAARFSLIGNPGGATITDNGGNLLNVAPQLGALANNGGSTLTMLPMTGSPLIDAGDPAFSGLATDQRGAGFPRVVNGRVDIGAVEAAAATAVAATATPAPGLGLGGKLGLGALLGLAGLAVTRRRRNLGTAAGILMAAALSMAAPTPALAKPWFAAPGGHASRHSEAATITSYTVRDKLVTIVLSDGQTIKTNKGHVHTIDDRSNAARRRLRDPSSVSAGTPAAVRYEIKRNGKVGMVRIHLTDTLEQARTFIAK
jgi:hypothetical protein